MMKNHFNVPPHSREELIERVNGLANLALGQIAKSLQMPLAKESKREKGWIGQLIECYLGATAGSKSVPDFELLGIELKTIPVNSQGLPCESTFVTQVILNELHEQTWETSQVKRKLRHVLWIPIESEPHLLLEDRRVGQGILWEPSPEQEAILKTDWEELTERILLGDIASITGRMGTYLQIRPKAAHSRVVRKGIGQSLTLPRGFYLRTLLTRQIFS